VAIDRSVSEGIGKELVTLYTALEARISAEVARRLRIGQDAPTWAVDRLAAAGDLSRWTQRLLAGLDKPTRIAASDAILRASVAGRTAALDEMERHAKGYTKKLIESGREALSSPERLPGQGAIAKLAGELSNKMTGTHGRILRWTQDAYRDVIGRTAALGVLAGLDTRRQASERAWNELLDKGITGFTDKAGRNWSLAGYVEMATRTAVTNASVDAHSDELGSLGIDYVMVSDAHEECARCRPWEGKILTRTGGGSFENAAESALGDGSVVRFQVAGSVADAKAGGLFHPQCRHRIVAYMPGLTQTPTNTEDPEGDKARQKLRALERKTRREKIKENAALTPEGKKAAKARVTESQKSIREHVKSTGTKRRPDREQIDLGNKRTPVKTTPPKPVKAVTPKPVKATPPKPLDDDYQATPITLRDQQIDRDIGNRDDRRAYLRKELDAGRMTQADHDAQLKRSDDYYNGNIQHYRADPDPKLDKVVGTKHSGTPSKERVRAHMRETTDQVPSRLRPDADAELARQGDIAPRSGMRFKRINVPEPGSVEESEWKADQNSSTNAFYRWADLGERGIHEMTMSPKFVSDVAGQERAHKYCKDIGWYSHSDETAFRSTMAHEYGHHMTTMIFDMQARYAGGDIDRNFGRELVDLIVREFGLGRQYPTDDAWIDLDDLVKDNAGTFKRGVSEYGSSSAAELLAEIWREYSIMGDRARPAIKAIGRLLQELAEKGAFK